MESILNIVYPCYNPAPGWELRLVQKHLSLLEKIPPAYTVYLVLVNDGSETGIQHEHIAYIQAQISNSVYIQKSSNDGKGAALRAAMHALPQGNIIYTDIDFPYREENVIEMFTLLAGNEADVVVGTRSASYYRQLPFSRLIFSLLLRVSLSIMFPRLLVKDTQSGLKGFNQKGKRIFLTTTIKGFLVDVEFILKCAAEKIQLSRIDLELNDNIQFSPVGRKILTREFRNFLHLLI